MDLDELAANLRESYRLIDSYQCAVLDLAADIAKRLGLTFFYWAPGERQRPCAPGTDLTTRSALEMLPLLDAWITYVTPGAVKPGSSHMLIVWPQADTALRRAGNAAALRSASKQSKPESQDAKTVIALWHVTVTDITGMRKNESFWDRVYDQSWPRKERFTLEIDGVKLQGGLRTYSWASFADAASTQKTVDEFARDIAVASAAR